MGRRDGARRRARAARSGPALRGVGRQLLPARLHARLAHVALAARAALSGKRGKKARALMASGKYTGAETLSNQSGRWELSK